MKKNLISLFKKHFIWIIFELILITINVHLLTVPSKLLGQIIDLLYNLESNHTTILNTSYFLLLMCFWEEMLSDEQIFKFRLFLEKYYKKENYLNIFENSILYNKEYQKAFNK